MIATGVLSCRDQSLPDTSVVTTDTTPLLDKAKALLQELGSTVLKRLANEDGAVGPDAPLPIDEELLIEAREVLELLLADPRQNAAEVWRLAGIVALQQKDTNLAAYAYHALAKDDQPPEGEGQRDELLSALSKMPIESILASIPGQGVDFLKLYDRVTNGDNSSAAALAERYLSGSASRCAPPDR